MRRGRRYCRPVDRLHPEPADVTHSWIDELNLSADAAAEQTNDIAFPAGTMLCDELFESLVCVEPAVGSHSE